MSDIIKAIQDTYLKKSIEQASTLKENKKRKVSKDEQFPVLEWTEDEKGHYLVELDYEAGEWYIYSGHWQVPWEDNQEPLLNNGNNDGKGIKPEPPPELPEQVNWEDMNAHVSQYFRISEVTQGDTRCIPSELHIKRNIMKIAKELDRVREQWGTPIGVISWYRPAIPSKEVGGVTKSQHISGLAADIYPMEGDLFEFQNWLDTQVWRDRALGYGAHRGFVHVDMRNSPIRWNY